MTVAELVATVRPCFSFEFSPPHTERGMESLLRAVARLVPLDPAFVAVTYHADGSTADQSVRLLRHFKHELGLEPMAHLTCVGQTRDEIARLLDRYGEVGVRTVLALRGDVRAGTEDSAIPSGGFDHASDLIAFIRERWDFSVGAACYPQRHPESMTWEHEVRSLRWKVDAGAEFLVTQMFTDNRLYFRFLRRARLAGLSVPILPGILPIVHVDKIASFASLTGRPVDPALRAEFERRAADPEGSLQLGVAHAAIQTQELLRLGAPGIHFYTRNRSPATAAILGALRAAHPWTRLSVASRVSTS